MVESRMESSIGRGGGQNEQFPVGMRVLAVDDDPTCLKVLEALLRRCRYHVTTTNQATMALKLLRENRDKFDLVISDVHMPDMDGFKLLELVGLEMDLPVIMLSVNGETKTVMKGITHGACDYLLKPVRLEELKNIWQHVVRRKFSHRDYGNFENREDSASHHTFNNESGHSVNTSELPNQNENLSRKRKDRSEEDDNDFEEIVHENEDPTAHKKPRVVWSIDLHRKFVAAVNQLGIDKAVPKRILELMNVDKITRENVASHLQKYRLYLKRLSAVASQQANMVAAFGGREASHLHMGSSDGFLNLRALAASGQIPSFTSLQPSGVLGRANTGGMRLCGLNSSEIVRIGHMNSTSIPTNDLIRPERVNLPGNQHASLLQGIPSSMELEHLQPNGVQEANSQLLGGLSGNGLATGNPPSSFIGVTSNALISQTLQQQTHSRGFVNRSSTQAPPVSSDSFHVNAGNSSQFPDLARCNATWQCALPLTGYGTNASSVSSFTNYDYLPKSTNNFLISQRNNRYQNIPAASLVGPTRQDPFTGRDGQSQSCSSNNQTMAIPTKADEETKFIKFDCSDSSRQRLEQKENLMNEHDVIFNSLSSSSTPNSFLIDPISGNQRMSNSHDSRMMDKHISSHTFANPILPLSHNIDKSNSDSLLKDKYTIQTTKMQGGISGCSLDDLVNSVIKPERDDISFADCDSGFDFYPLGACL